MVEVRTLLMLLVATTALAGCFGGDSPDDDGDPVGSADPRGPFAHHGSGNTSVLADPASIVFADPLLKPTATGRYLPVSTFEPTIGATSDGCLFMTSFVGSGLPGGTAIMRSCDKGETWEDKSPWLVEGEARCFPNSNDPYVHVDRDTDRIFTSDLHALLTSTLSFSDDGGDSWTCNVVGGGLPPGVHDHQTIATGTPRMLPTVEYDNMVYYCVNRVADSVCSSSVNGGLGFGPFILVYPGVEGGELCGGLHGHAETDHAGRVYLPKGQCGVPEVAVSEDDGLTWTRHVISSTTGITGHEVRIAADDADNIYAFWIGADLLPYFAASTDHGATWSEAFVASPPDVTMSGLPAIYAGAEGRVVFAYAGSTTEGGSDSASEDRTWNGYMGILYDALDDEPLVLTVTANDPADPLHRGQSCWSDRCGGLGDFIDVTIDPEGRPWAAFSDHCHENCTDPDATENQGPSLGFVGTLRQGESLRVPGQALEVLDEMQAPEAA